MTTLTGLFTLGKDAETRTTQGGTEIVELSVVYEYGPKRGDGKRPAQWVRLSMFGKSAIALAPYLRKGKQVSLVVRDLHVREYQKKDGTTGVALEGDADFDAFARSAPAEHAKPAPKAAAPRQQAPGGFNDMEDDIPF